MDASGVRSSCETVATNSVRIVSSRRSFVTSLNAYTVPSVNATPVMESQSSRPSMSSGTVSARAISACSPGREATGTSGPTFCQPESATSAECPHMSPEARPVIASAAVFHRRMTPSESIRKTPSPTCESTRAAWIRCWVESRFRATMGATA